MPGPANRVSVSTGGVLNEVNDNYCGSIQTVKTVATLGITKLRKRVKTIDRNKMCEEDKKKVVSECNLIVKTETDFEELIDEMAVKKHGLVTNNSNQLDLQALAQYIQLMNEQPGYLPPVPDLVKNCQDIVKCLARSPGNEERRWEMLQSIEEFLLRVVNTVDEEARTAIVNGVIDKFYSFISDPQSDANAATSIVLVVLDTSSVESLMPTTRWVVQRGENEPAAAGLRASLSCLYSWLAENPPQGTPVLGDWIMSFIKALEEKQCFDILIEVSVNNVDRLFCAMNDPATLQQSGADVICHVLSALRESVEAFDKILNYVGPVLTNLASDSGQFSRQLLQNTVDILTASAEHHLENHKGNDKTSFNEKYGEVSNEENFYPGPSIDMGYTRPASQEELILQPDHLVIINNLCLERHMASRGCELLKTAPWPNLEARVSLEPLIVNPAPASNKVGLLNLGNTCYMNSVMQALLVTRRFSSHVMLHMTEHPYWETTAMLFGKLVYSMCNKLNSREFFNTMRPSFFSFNHQQDSSEFLGYLFELLQSYEHVVDDNHDYSKRPVLGITHWRASGNSNSDGEGAASSSNRRSISPRPGGSGGSTSSSKRCGGTDLDHQPPNKRTRVERRFCFVDSIFGGVVMTRVQCVVCKFTSVNRDVFRDLSLAFPEKKTEHSVQSLLEFFCQKEVMTGDNRYLCSDCGILREAERSVIIETAPKILILVLKHFKFEPKLQVQSKLIHNMYYNQNIKLPLVGNRHDTIHGYTLYAAVIHDGSTLDSGHYFTLAKDGGSWYEFNDDEVTCATENQINELQLANTPYILFYRREDVEAGAAPSLDVLPTKIHEHILAHNKHYLDSLRP